MKIILNPHDGASQIDMIAMARTAHFALDSGIADRPAGYIMAVTLGGDVRQTYGVVRRKGSVSVYPPAVEAPDA